MKKRLTATALLATFALAGCSSTGTLPNAGGAVGTATDIGMNVLKTVIDTQCRAEIEKQTAWRVASVVMNDAQKEAVQSKVCGCVTEQAPQHVTIVELGNAAINPEYRVQLATRVIAKSLQSCYASFAK